MEIDVNPMEEYEAIDPMTFNENIQVETNKDHHTNIVELNNDYPMNIEDPVILERIDEDEEDILKSELQLINEVDEESGSEENVEYVEEKAEADEEEESDVLENQTDDVDEDDKEEALHIENPNKRPLQGSLTEDENLKQDQSNMEINKTQKTIF
ncbi:uncharacterized protein KGF55_004529 [Candida pseudojiufengensis]|uniref:uncharacterized protein n=1 Tax=Candida pseudojiufengensis TaxID=497109 RepID=UPI002224573A|nr:uncharacterized protein KGF55_004529 [Candida pseudojiufengensis]KAI5960636.1 hypothetical protein KGF55_004529 [Candida pseudojiufengensis]